MKYEFIVNFYKIFELVKPQRICEIGTHNGKSAGQMSAYLLELGIDVDYTGYDMFEQALDPAFQKLEHNGKGAGIKEAAVDRLTKIQQQYPKFKFKLIQGNTNNTLTPGQYFDFVFIDGGHSYDTVKHDYQMVQQSPVIIFDDCQIEAVYRFVTELDNVFELKHNGRPKRRQFVKTNDLELINRLKLESILK